MSESSKIDHKHHNANDVSKEPHGEIMIQALALVELQRSSHHSEVKVQREALAKMIEKNPAAAEVALENLAQLQDTGEGMVAMAEIKRQDTAMKTGAIMKHAIAMAELQQSSPENAEKAESHKNALAALIAQNPNEAELAMSKLTKRQDTGEGVTGATEIKHQLGIVKTADNIMTHALARAQLQLTSSDNTKATQTEEGAIAGLVSANEAAAKLAVAKLQKMQDTGEGRKGAAEIERQMGLTPSDKTAAKTALIQTMARAVQEAVKPGHDSKAETTLRELIVANPEVAAQLRDTIKNNPESLQMDKKTATKAVEKISVEIANAQSLRTGASVEPKRFEVVNVASISAPVAAGQTAPRTLSLAS